MNQGDTVFIDAGTYTTGLSANFLVDFTSGSGNNDAGSVGAQLVFKGAGYLKSNLSGNNSKGVINLGTANNYVTFCNLAVVNGNKTTAATLNGLKLENIKFNNNSTISSAGGGAIVIDNGSKVVLKNCLFYSNSAASGYGGAILITGANAYGEINNCTFHNNAGSAADIARRSSGKGKVINSICWSGTTSVSSADASMPVTYSNIRRSSGTYSGGGNINQDPLFVNSAAFNYALQASSPSKEKGKQLSIYETDITGYPRGTNPKPDQGCFQSLASAPVAAFQTDSIHYFLNEGFDTPWTPDTNGVPQGGWTKINGHSNPAYNWKQDDATNFNFQQINPNHVKSAMVQWVAANQNENLITPQINTTGASNLHLSFYAGFSKTYLSNATLKCFISVNNGTTWAELWNAISYIEDPETYAWRYIYFNLDSYKGQNIKLKWQYIGNDGDIAGLEDVKLYEYRNPAPIVVEAGHSVTFKDFSTNWPSSWSWSFPGGTPSVSAEQNPVIAYFTGGTYNVSLTSTNAAGQNSITRTGYIHVIGQNVSVTGVSINQQNLSLINGQTVTLQAAISPDNASNKSVTWSSDNSSVASVNPTGYGVANGIGTANIIVTTQDGGFKDTCSVTVTSSAVSVTGISLNLDSLSLVKGAQETLIATISPANATNKNVIFNISDTTIALVSQSGVVSALKVGSAFIVALSEDGNFTDTCRLLVLNDSVPVTGITINHDTVMMQVNGNVSLTANIIPANASNKNKDWYSANNSLVTVNSNGYLTAHDTGITYVYAITQEGNYSDTCIVIINLPNLTGLQVMPAELNLLQGSTASLLAFPVPFGANANITWNSSDTNIALVNQNGVVTAKTTGSVYIIAEADLLYKDTCLLTVSAIPLTRIDIHPSSLVMETGTSALLTVSYSPLNASNKNVTWHSSSAPVATVTNGNIQALTSGQTFIFAVSQDGSYSDTCNATVVQSSTPNEVVIYDQNYGSGTCTMPNGWSSPSTRWKPDNVPASTGYTGASGACHVNCYHGSLSSEAVLVFSNVSTTGYSDIKIIWGGYRSSTFTNTLTVEWSSDSITWNALSFSDVTNNATWALVNNGTPIALPSGAANKSSLRFRFRANRIPGQWYGIDDFKVYGTTSTASTNVTGVSLSPDIIHIPVGSQNLLNAIVKPTNAINKNVSWNSLNNSIATVSSGTISAAGVGNTLVIVTTQEDGFKDTTTVQVYQPVTGITLNTEYLSLMLDSIAILSAQIVPVNASNQNYTWGSLDPNIASVSNGIVTPVNPGKTLVYARSEYGNHYAFCYVHVKNIPVSGITLDYSDVTLEIGDTTLLLTATVNPVNATNKNVIWPSNNSAIATITNGTITPVTMGTTYVSATTLEGNFTATCVVRIVDSIVHVTSVNINQDSLVLNSNGASQLLTATILPANATNKSLIWSSANPSIASVLNGTITPHIEGNTWIYAISVDGGLIDSCAVTVRAFIAVNGINIIDDSIMVPITGNPVACTVQVLPANATNKNINWSVKNTDIAIVTSGIIIPMATGTTMLYAVTQDGGYIDSCEVIVYVPVTSVNLSANQIIVSTTGQPYTLTAQVLPANATYQTINWYSTDTTILKVNNGLIIPIGAGNATIYAVSVEDGHYDSCIVTVNIGVTGLNILQDTIVLGTASGPDTLYAITIPANATNQNFSWISGNVNIVTVNNGIVTPVAGGNAFVYAISNDGGYLDSCFVKVNISVTSINLVQTSVTLVEGGNHDTLTVYVFPLNATNRDVIWYSSDINVITVDNGIITSVNTGNAKVFVESVDRHLVDSCLVIVTPLSISEHQKDAEIFIYPNPADDFIYISHKMPSDLISVKIVDISGKTITTLTHNDFKANAILKVDIHHLSPGMYVLQLESKTCSYKKPLIKN